MYKLKYSKSFKKGFKRVSCSKAFAQKEFESVVNSLINRKVLGQKYLDHALKGEFVHCREMHLSSDILIIYEIDKKEGVVYLYRIGSHTELF